jgi:hypothetical protein
MMTSGSLRKVEEPQQENYRQGNVTYRKRKGLRRIVQLLDGQMNLSQSLQPRVQKELMSLLS